MSVLCLIIMVIAFAKQSARLIQSAMGCYECRISTLDLMANLKNFRGLDKASDVVDYVVDDNGDFASDVTDDVDGRLLLRHQNRKWLQKPRRLHQCGPRKRLGTRRRRGCSSKVVIDSQWDGSGWRCRLSGGGEKRGREWNKVGNK